MSESIDIGPLRLHRDESQWRFEFQPAAADLRFEIPADYERTISQRLTELLPSLSSASIHLDLNSRPAISSRQLGVMLALHKALRATGPRLRLARVHSGVRRLLEVTHTLQFFEILENGEATPARPSA